MTPYPTQYNNIPFVTADMNRRKKQHCIQTVYSVGHQNVKST
jgi:hypothetical protein